MSQLSTRVYTIVLLTVVCVILALNVLDALSEKYAVPDTLNAVLSITMGAAFGQHVFKRQQRGERDD